MTAPSPEQLRRWDAEHVWHPFTPHSVYLEEEPLMIVAGEGNELIDIDGRRYIDGVASIWCNALGHRRPEIDQAVRDQLDRIAHCTLLGHTSPPAVVLAKRLVDIAPPGLTRVFFSDDGSTAVEAAAKIAYQYWQQVSGAEPPGGQPKTRFLTLANAYHGDTVGSVSLGGIDLFHRVYRPLLFETLTAPSPSCYHCTLCAGSSSCSGACLDAMLRLIDENAGALVAVVIEPGFQGASGILPLPDGYLTRVAEATRAAGALLILDEVAAGMGRTGTMFACQRENVAPDLLCTAKGLTGGYLPLAATLATEEVFEAFLGPPEEGRTFFHGHTFTGNPLGAAAALATLDIFEREQIVAGLQPKIRHLRVQLERLRSLEWVGDIRQCGLAAGIELVADRDRREPFPASERTGVKVCRAAREQGVFLRPLGDVIVIMPPLTITLEQITLIVDAIEVGIRAVPPPSPLALPKPPPSPLPPPHSPKTFLVTGTDTGVGKTLVTAGLARALCGLGLGVRAIKPIETGTRVEVSQNEDGTILAQATGQDEPLHALIRLREPVAAPVAAETDSVEIDFNTLVSETAALCEPADVALVEGAGGLLSPLTWTRTAIDLAKELNAVAIVVGRDALGTINHTHMTVRLLQMSGVEVAAVVLSTPAEPDYSTGSNVDSLRRVLSPEVRLIALPRVTGISAAAEHLEELARWLSD
jgi:adenosylmethionine-8-amino-7-oxononanoate aminotransferase